MDLNSIPSLFNGALENPPAEFNSKAPEQIGYLDLSNKDRLVADALSRIEQKTDWNMRSTVVTSRSVHRQGQALTVVIVFLLLVFGRAIVDWTVQKLSWTTTVSQPAPTSATSLPTH